MLPLFLPSGHTASLAQLPPPPPPTTPSSFAYVMSYDHLLEFQYFVHTCVEQLINFLGGTGTGSTNFLAGKGLKRVEIVSGYHAVSDSPLQSGGKCSRLPVFAFGLKMDLQTGMLEGN